MIELRQLSYFVAACHQTNFTEAAKALDIAPSTLSTALENLEKKIGAQLFSRVSTGLTPTVAGRWLYRAAIPVLQAETFTRHAAHLDVDTILAPLIIDIRLMFSLGNLSRAICSALTSLQTDHPNVFIEQHWSSFEGDPPLPASEISGAGRLVLSYDAGGEVVYEDPWVLARAFPAETDILPQLNQLLAGPIVVPALPEPLKNDLDRYLADHRLPGLRWVSDHPGTLARLAGEHPDAAFLLPRSMLAHRMGLHRFKLLPLDPMLVSAVRSHIAAPHPLAHKTARRILKALAANDIPPPFQPQLTRRQLQYFRLVDSHRNLTAAARSAKVAQPALTGQIRKMEQTLATPLFERRRDGLLPTAAGNMVRMASDYFDRHLQSLAIHSAGVLGHNRSRLRIGILPTAGQESAFLNWMTDAILEWRDKYPRIDLQVVEAPTDTLQEWVRSGEISLAILETDPPHMARFNLERTEALALICNPALRAELGADAAIGLERLCKLPLVLPTPAFGIRRILDDLASAQHLTLEPVMEINSLPMLTAMLRRRTLGTVLPPSAVQHDLERGVLESVPLEPDILRRLFVIYSSARALTEAERELVRRLRGTMAA